MNTIDWNDLRCVAAVATAKSAAGAARLLGVSNATVLRRLHLLEQQIGTPLFMRATTGYTPTDAGRQLAEMAASIHTSLTDVQRAIDGHATELKGTVQFTTTDSLAHALMPDILHSFQQRYPEIHVDMTVTNTRLDLDRRDADVALRPTVAPPESWVGIRLAPLPMGLYASTAYLQAREGAAWQALDWVLPRDPQASHPITAWLKRHLPDARPVITVDSFIAARDLALAGLGATVLPAFMARNAPLTLLQELPADLHGAVWLLTHAKLRHAQRIKAFMQHVAAGVRDRLNPTPPAGPHRRA